MDDLARQFSTHLASLTAELDACWRALSAKLQPNYTFRWAAQSQAKPGMRAIKAWVEAGAGGDPPVAPEAVRASIYDLARPASQLRAFGQVNRVASLKHLSSIQAALERRDFLLGFSLLRGLFERAGHASLLARSLQPLRGLKSTEPSSFERVLEMGEVIARSLYLVGFDWSLLAKANFREVSPKSAKYVQVPDTNDLSVRSILNGIDALNTRCAGTRLCYEFMCGFLHPNIGDLITSSLSANTREDVWGTMTAERIIGEGPNEFSGQWDVIAAVSNFMDAAASVVAEIPKTLEELDDLSQLVDRITKSAQHRTGKLQKNLFRRDDLCPCLSGRTWVACGGAAHRPHRLH